MYAEGRFIDQSMPEFEPISIVIPAHNESKYLKNTIQALQKAIADVVCEAEIIVVNDDSSDDTADIARSMGVRVIDVSLRNIGAVRNAGAKVARHEWLFFVDADTLVPAETLRQSLQAMAQGDVGGGARVDMSDEQPIFFVKRIMYYMVVLVWNIIGGWAAGCFMFCRKELFDSFGGFDEEYFAAEELFFSKELKQRGKFRLAKYPVVTSARKLHNYSTWDLIKFVSTPLFQFTQMLKSRKGLDLLYEDNR